MVRHGISKTSPHPSGKRYRRARQMRLDAPDGDICWWCRHPGADEVDHLVPRSLDPTRDVADIDNLAPIHGRKGCPYCPYHKGKPRRCNQERGNKTTDPTFGYHSSDW